MSNQLLATNENKMDETTKPNPVVPQEEGTEEGTEGTEVTTEGETAA